MHSFLLVEITAFQAANPSVSLSGAESAFSTSTTLNLVVDCYLRLLSSNYLEINFASRQTLLHLVKPPKKASSSSSSTIVGVPSTSTSQAKAHQASSTSNKSSSKSTTNAQSNPTLPTAPASGDSTSLDETVRFGALNLNQNANLNELNEYMEMGNSIMDELLVEDVVQSEESSSLISGEAIAAIINNGIEPVQNNDNSKL